MKIPYFHYQDFWFINSALSAGTGFVLAIMASRFSPILDAVGISLESPIWTFTAIFFVLYQSTFFSYFWGKRRGAFEYSYFERNIEHTPETKKILEEAKQELKSGDHKSANSKLKNALLLAPENFVVHFKLAASFENLGQSEEAIKSYEQALANLPEKSEPLQKYIQNQIDRVETKGPTKKTAPPGLRFVIY
ncbi:tetratricopeptide repeat protein [uncultured Desulfuromusa sp.]|uniref:tetratricopeptide repeat protein n=1 Tax=uncultured Desulfuromusa sp. TaxID=219183 RepID=UPI002AA8AAB7|nr:tetratricopeptide repeat protein [uncultured Desulfuromusa sp.]